jgi:subtilisin family serine protease
MTMNERDAGGAQGQMPGGNMGEGDPGMPVFKPSDAAPGTPQSPSWEPGVVEVQFREGVRPEVQVAEADAPPQISSPTEADLTPLNRILRQHRLREVEPTFETSPESAEAAQTVAQRRGIETPNLRHFVTLRFPTDAEVRRIAQELNQLEDVEQAAPVPRAVPPQTPLNEPRVGMGDQVVVDPASNLENQWYIFRCRANDAWGMSSGRRVVIADIDWGYRTTHKDLAPRLDLSHAYNSFDGGTNVSHGTSVSHGTAVLGLAGAADNDLGMAGFAFRATLWPVQANSGPGTALGGNAWARAIDWVRTANSGGRRKVIILEVQTGAFGNYEQVLSVNAAIRTAIANGVVVCVAAGNGDRDAGLDDVGDPIRETGSILVGATAYHATENRRAGFSNYGARVTVSAPGDPSHDLTCSTASDTAYMNGFGGTSGATPKVAATAALMLAVDPTLTHKEIRTILRDTGSAVITDSKKPVGTLLNSKAAVRTARLD